MSLRVVEHAHRFVVQAVAPGDTAIDLTVGTGADTLLLARAVGPTGRVIGFDIQPSAIEQTRQRLTQARVTWAELREECHTRVAGLESQGLRAAVGAIMINLGYLPGGDQAIITRPEATVAALRASLALLRPGGVLTAVAYTGHPGGYEEALAVRSLLAELDASEFQRLDDARLPFEPPAPRLIAIRRIYPSFR